jgi:NADH:ubiquinone reductase (non-electrogenic)
MATKQAIRPLLRLNALRPVSSSSIALARRNLSTFSHRPSSPQLQLSRALIKPTITRYTFQQSLKRSYADIVSPKPKRRIRTALRWLWRFTYLGVIGFLAYTGYTIYLLRTPSEQEEADPSKKTLVILGICSLIETTVIDVDR